MPYKTRKNGPHRTLAEKFCSCVGNVQKSMKLPASNEGRAIAVCVKSVLQTRGRTMKRFSCRGKTPKLQTQKMKLRK